MKKRISIIFIVSVIVACILTGCGLFGNHQQPTIVPGGPTSGATPTVNIPDTPTPKPQVTTPAKPTDPPTSAPTSTPSDIPDDVPSETPTPTETPTDTPTPTATSTPTATPTPYPENACRQAAEKAVGAEYTITAGEQIVVSGVSFYKYFASRDGKVLSPAIAVNPRDKSLYYYYDTGEIAPFDVWPVDNGEKQEGQNDLTGEEVVKILKTIPADRLGFNGNISECTFEIQGGVTMLGDDQPYFSVDMLLGTRRVGIYFISQDRSTVFREDEFGDRILIK